MGDSPVDSESWKPNKMSEWIARRGYDFTRLFCHLAKAETKYLKETNSI